MQKLKIEITFTQSIKSSSLTSWTEYIVRMIHEIEPRVKSISCKIIEENDVQTSISI